MDISDGCLSKVSTKVPFKEPRQIGESARPDTPRQGGERAGVGDEPHFTHGAQAAAGRRRVREGRHPHAALRDAHALVLHEAADAGGRDDLAGGRGGRRQGEVRVAGRTGTRQGRVDGRGRGGEGSLHCWWRFATRLNSI